MAKMTIFIPPPLFEKLIDMMSELNLDQNYQMIPLTEIF